MLNMAPKGNDMNLTSQQLDSIRGGDSVKLTEQGTEIVIVRADVFAKLQAPRYDASPWTDDEMDLLAAEDADSLGWEGTDVYQDQMP